MKSPIALAYCSVFATAIGCIGVVASSVAETKHLLTPEDCAAINYLAPDELTDRPALQLSPDGTFVAYIVQTANVGANANMDTLYVKRIQDSAEMAAVPIVIHNLIAAPHWFPDNRNIAALVRQGQKTVLMRIDTHTKTETLMWEARGNITDYSLDARGATVAVAVRVDPRSAPRSNAVRDDLRGYRIDMAQITHSDSPRRQIYILRRTDGHRWKPSNELVFASPLSGRILKDIEDNHALHINLSPDGKYLLMDNREAVTDIPTSGEWGKSSLVKYMKTKGGVVVNYLYNVASGVVSMPLKSPLVFDATWSPDSTSYMEVALPPADSKWEASDLASGPASDHITHLFNIDVRTGAVSEVLSRAEEVPAAWPRINTIIVRSHAGAFVTMTHDSDEWRQVQSVQLPLPDAAPYSPATTDGERVIMEYENARTPPQLTAFDLSSNRVWTLARLNPQVDDLILPQAQPLTWTTSSGFTARGLLLLPPDYNPQRRYPLVIEDGSILYSGGFVCDSGEAHVSSFARGLLADSGIAYLMRYWPGNDVWENRYYPKGYPGGIAEAAFKQDLVESAIATLDAHQIIDPNNVGLIGFSRGGWYVEYTLTHSQIQFRAATATDNVLYSMGEYWYWNGDTLARNEEAMYGALPYGKDLKSWLENSISFTLDRIHTPLLMEVMGYGRTYDDPNEPPDNLAVHKEPFVGLTRLHRPVELYYYPQEQHQASHPQARIASLQRNLDWYRFWLQGYERPNTADPDQYERWRRMQSEMHSPAGSDGDSATSTDGMHP